MKILLINPPIENIIESNMPKELESGMDFLPPLGLMYIAGYLQKETPHQVEIFDSPVERASHEELKTEIKKRNPDVIGITAMTFTLIDVIKVAKNAKQINPDVKIILGGPHIITYPEETISIPEIDFLVLGEGEKVIKPLLENLNNPTNLKNIKGLVFRHNGKTINTGRADLAENLDAIPFPARRLTPYKKYFSVVSSRMPVTTMFTSRGCPYKCLFCDRPNLGKIFRSRSAQNVVQELDEIQKMGIKEVFIYDDTFTVDRKRVVDICNLILEKNIKLSWDIRARVNTVDEELLKLMKRAGCGRIHYGVEAGTEKILTVLRKGITVPMIKKAFEWTKKAGIETAGYFMLGSPTETIEDIDQTVALSKELFPDYVHFTVLTPFPATDLYAKGLAEGVIKEDYWREFSKNPKPGFKPPAWEENFTREELFALLKKAYRSFYLRPSYIIKRIIKLKSLKDLAKKASTGLKLLKI